MTAAKDILDKAKWGQLTGAEINALGLALSDPNEPDLYTVIHAIGKAELKQYKVKLESFLDYPGEPLISAITVKVLCGFWELTDQYIDVILKFIPLLLEDAGVLPSLFRRSHIANYAPAVSLTRRLPESSMILAIFRVLSGMKMRMLSSSR